MRTAEGSSAAWITWRHCSHQRCMQRRSQTSLLSSQMSWLHRWRDALECHCVKSSAEWWNSHEAMAVSSMSMAMVALRTKARHACMPASSMVRTKCKCAVKLPATCFIFPNPCCLQILTGRTNALRAHHTPACRCNHCQCLFAIRHRRAPCRPLLPACLWAPASRDSCPCHCATASCSLLRAICSPTRAFICRCHTVSCSKVQSVLQRPHAALSWLSRQTEVRACLWRMAAYWWCAANLQHSASCRTCWSLQYSTAHR